MAGMPLEPALETTKNISGSPALQSPESLLRFSTAGSVDDGKSTLIGRLLYDSQAVFDDQLAGIKRSKFNRSNGPIDFSLLTDGLHAEREQGITIDVAYRYFAIRRRKFIIADTPGHEQYTRNMATGSSTAQLSVILIDATKGVLRQSRRHTYIADLLGVQRIVAAVNKMDLVGYSQEVFERVSADFRKLADQLGVRDVYALPLSALEGENVVRSSERMPWFQGPSLLEFLETVSTSDTDSCGPVRFPVQCVIRPDASFRGFAGRLASGQLRPGSHIVALPSRVRTTVQSILSFEDELDAAHAGDSITLTLTDEIDLSRGDMLVDEDRSPCAGTEFQATVVWMDAEPLDPHKIYLVKHTTRTVHGRVSQIRYAVDVNTLEHIAVRKLGMNDVAAVDVKTTLPLFFDPYEVNHTTGSFIFIDPVTNATIAAGIIEGASESCGSHASQQRRSTHEERILRYGHAAAAVWLKGRCRAAELVERILFDEGWHVQLAGPDDFLPDELATAAKAYHSTGHIAIFSPLEGGANQKRIVRAIYGPESFIAVNVDKETDEEAAAHVVSVLRRWLDSHSCMQERDPQRGSSSGSFRKRARDVGRKTTW